MFDAIDFKWYEKTDQKTKLNREIRRLEGLKRNFCEEKEEIIRINGKIEGIEYAINVLKEENQESQMGKIKMSIEDAVKELKSLSPSETAINMVLQHLKFYKDGLKREIESNRENVLEIIDKDQIIDAMAEEIFIKRAYSITCKADIQRLKNKIIEEYKNKV